MSTANPDIVAQPVRTVIERYTAPCQLLEYIVGDSLLLEMLYDELHGRIVSKGAILLIETEMCWVKVEDQGSWFATEFSEDVFSCAN